MSKNKKQEINNTEWFRLDNAALIYPSVSTNSWNSVYRVSALLNEQVNEEVLQQALNDIITRFPMFNVSLKKGLFWYYFQGLNKKPKIIKDRLYPCQKMDLRPGRHLFRVLYYNKKVSFEAFHSLTDGYGAVMFLNTLLTRYFDLVGNKINKKVFALSYLDKPTTEELEDSFNRHADLKEKNKWKENKAYQIIGTKEVPGKLNIINGIMQADKVKELAHKYDATVTEFLLAVLFKSVLQYQQIRGNVVRPVRISVPINLRRFFGSKTLRNFSSYMNMEFYPEDKDKLLKEIIKEIKNRSRSIDKEYVMRNINANVAAQKNIFLRLTPLFIKDLILKLVFSVVGEKIFTMSMSNVGLVKAPKEFENLVDRYEVNLGAGKLNTMGTTVLTFNNKLVFTFSSTIKETDLQKMFFRSLTDLGLEIKIESNK